MHTMLHTSFCLKVELKNSIVTSLACICWYYSPINCLRVAKCCFAMLLSFLVAVVVLDCSLGSPLMCLVFRLSLLLLVFPQLKGFFYISFVLRSVHVLLLFLMVAKSGVLSCSSQCYLDLICTVPEFILTSVFVLFLQPISECSWASLINLSWPTCAECCHLHWRMLKQWRKEAHVSEHESELCSVIHSGFADTVPRKYLRII